MRVCGKAYTGTEMSEWLKILVSAIAGMTVGTLLEPLKFAINNRLKARQVRRTIYEELAALYDFIRGLQNPQTAISGLLYDSAILRTGRKSITHEEHVKDRLAIWHFDIFDHYYQTERSTFYRLQEARVLKNIVDQSRKWLNSSDPPLKKLDNLAHWMNCVDSSLSLGELDRTVFTAAQKQVRKDHFGISVPRFIAPILAAYLRLRKRSGVIHVRG